MNVTRGMRLHIGFFGKTNAGKSTLMNKISGQELSIVSNVKGTTTDVNKKAMELLPIGPVVLMDTAGIDDVTELGKLRVQKSKNALMTSDVVVFVCDNEKLNQTEKDFIKELKNVTLISVINKTDLGELNKEDETFLNEHSSAVLKTSGVQKDNFIFEFKQALIKNLPDDYINKGIIFSDIVKKDDVVVLVIPIDKEAPKGRIILPQVNALREALDNNAISVVFGIFTRPMSSSTG